MQHAAAEHSDRSNRGRLAVFGVLALSEILLVSYAFNFPTGIPEWMNPVTYAKVGAQAVFASLVALFIAAWPMRERVAQAWDQEMRGYNWRAAGAADATRAAPLFLIIATRLTPHIGVRQATSRRAREFRSTGLTLFAEDRKYRTLSHRTNMASATLPLSP